MKDTTLISILVFILLLFNFFVMISINPTKAEVESYFKKSSCDSQDVEAWYDVKELCVYHLRRHTAILWGQIFNVPQYSFLFVYTPFNYYHDITDSDDDWWTYTWVDTREGRFVYNAVNGEYVKEIDNKEDPTKKWIEDMDELAEDLKRLSNEK